MYLVNNMVGILTLIFLCYFSLKKNLTLHINVNTSCKNPNYIKYTRIITSVLSRFFSWTQIPFKQNANSSKHIFYHFLLKITDSITAKLERVILLRKSYTFSHKLECTQIISNYNSLQKLFTPFKRNTSRNCLLFLLFYP